MFSVFQVTGEPLIRRSDDTEEKLRKRMEVYRQQTEPLVDFYAKKQILTKINADQPREEVSMAIGKIILEKYLKTFSMKK